MCFCRNFIVNDPKNYKKIFSNRNLENLQIVLDILFILIDISKLLSIPKCHFLSYFVFFFLFFLSSQAVKFLIQIIKYDCEHISQTEIKHVSNRFFPPEIKSNMFHVETWNWKNKYTSFFFFCTKHV